MLQRLSARKRDLMWLLTLTMIFLAAYWGLNKMLLPRYFLLDRAAELAKGQLRSAEESAESLNESKGINIKLRDKYLALEKMVSKDLSNGVNYYFVGKIAHENQIKVIKAIPYPEKSNKYYYKTILDIQARGKYHNILVFIQNIEENMPNLTEIKNLVLHAAETEKENTPAEERLILENDPDIVLSMTMVTYTLNQPTEKIAINEEKLGRWDIFSPAMEFSQINDQDLSQVKEDEQAPLGEKDHYHVEESIRMESQPAAEDISQEIESENRSEFEEQLPYTLPKKSD